MHRTISEMESNSTEHFIFTFTVQKQFVWMNTKTWWFKYINMYFLVHVQYLFTLFLFPFFCLKCLKFLLHNRTFPNQHFLSPQYKQFMTLVIHGINLFLYNSLCTCISFNNYLSVFLHKSQFSLNLWQAARGPYSQRAGV